MRMGFNAYGFMFSDSVNTVLKSFNAANTALLNDLALAEDDANSFSPDHSWEDDAVSEQHEILAYRIEAAEEALQTLRKAYALILYHTWERAARTWAKTKVENHDQLKAAVIARGVPIQPELDDLRILANTLKHDKATWGTKLAKVQGGAFFKPGFVGSDSTDWYEEVVISSAMMVALFNAVSDSGPNIHSSFPH